MNMKTSFGFIKVALVTFSFFTTACTITNCAKKEDKLVNSPPVTELGEHESIRKSTDIYYDVMEAAPFEFKGKLYLVIGERGLTPKDPKRFSIIEFETKEKVGTLDEDLDFPSVVTVDEKIYIFGTIGHGTDDASIHQIETNDLKTFSEPKLIYKSKPEQRVFNTTVTKTEDGFTLAYEVSEPNTVNFSVRFLQTTDLQQWSEIPGSYLGDGFYSACPTIRKFGEYYYVWYLVTIGKKENVRYDTQIARSKDLVNWDFSKRVFLTPGQNEGRNNSDMDIIEFNGLTYIFYAIGDQIEWAQLKYAISEMPLGELVEQYFP